MTDCKVVEPSSGGDRIISLGVILVNHSEKVLDAIGRGNYSQENDKITQENFPTKREGSVGAEISLFSFAQSMHQEGIYNASILIAMNRAGRVVKKDGHRPAELLDLLAISDSVKHLDLRKDFKIIALGSVWTEPKYGDYYVACLHHDPKKQSLDIEQCAGPWIGNYCFAGVRV